MQRLKRIDATSALKMGGVLYAIFGLLAGVIISLVSMAMPAASREEMGPFGMFGAMAVIAFPVLYGLFGAIFSAIAALLYNVVAGFVGGLAVEIE
jgi:hypothetical protein